MPRCPLTKLLQQQSEKAAAFMLRSQTPPPPALWFVCAAFENLGICLLPIWQYCYLNIYFMALCWNLDFRMKTYFFCTCLFDDIGALLILLVSFSPGLVGLIRSKSLKFEFSFFSLLDSNPVLLKSNTFLFFAMWFKKGTTWRGSRPIRGQI